MSCKSQQSDYDYSTIRKAMPACLEFRDFFEVNEPAISELKAFGERHTDETIIDEDTCKVFSKTVKTLEGNLRHTYGLMANATRKTESLEEIAEIWQMMRNYCAVILKAVQDLVERFPHCGTPELHNLALDYWLACDERHREAEGEIACQQKAFPKAIFPKTS